MNGPFPKTLDSNSTLSQNAAAPCDSIPTHVAIIMDGNGRWATGQGKPREDGHRAGTGNIRRIIESFTERGVKYLTLFAFSTENWERPGAEVQALIDIIRDVIYREVQALHEQGVRILHLGRLDRLSEDLQQAIHDSVHLTRDNIGMTLCVAFDYGGRAEILGAVRQIVADEIPPERIDEELFGGYLHTSGIPDPDLIIRTAGEMRLSNFLLWQSAYAEYYATSVYWPDFDEDEIAKALAAFGKRQRRFGKV